MTINKQHDIDKQHDIYKRHDKFFKENFTIKDNAIDFVQGVLPEEILEVLDTTSLTLANTSYIDQQLDEYFSDVVYDCSTKDKRNKLQISFLFEHKSYQDPLIRVQLLNYIAKTWDTQGKQNKQDKRDKQGKQNKQNKHDKRGKQGKQGKQSNDISLVIPIVLYHGLKNWQVRKFRDYFVGLPKVFYRFVPEFDYLLVDLSKYSNKQIKDGSFTKAQLKLALLLMKNILDEKELAKNLNVFFEICKQYFEEESGLRFLESVFKYLSTTELKQENIITAVNKVSEKGENVIMTLATKLREEGEVKGEVKGLLEAIEMGLDFKFSTAGLDLFEKIKGINDLNRIKLIKNAVKTAVSLNEVSRLIEE